MGKNDKTNVMRVLDQKKINYRGILFEELAFTNGVDIASYLKEDPDLVYKTLVTTGKGGAHYVFVIPVAKELDLKKAAKVVGEKAIEMLHQKDLLPLTGYVHGGCSPIGMKKFFRTVIDASAQNHEKIYFSAGKIGAQVEIATCDIAKAIRFEFADVTVD